MRITKKDIYQKYGIEYTAKNQHIMTPLGSCRELLKAGNSKTGKTVLTWSMNQTTCICHCEGCYADAGHYKRASVQNSMNRNTELAKHHLDFLKRAIMAQLETKPAGTEVRIHAVGDFFSKAYVEMWREIIKAFPGLIFWTYTKTAFETAFDDLENANIVKSYVNGRVNFGHCDHVMNLYKELTDEGKNVHICRCGVDDSQHCAGCHKCSDSEYVLFLEHSTGYNAKADALYQELKNLIDNQPA